MKDEFVDWVDLKVLETLNITHLSEAFERNEPFRYLEMKGFLNESKIMALLDAVLKEQWLEKYSDLFSFKQTDDLKATKNKLLKGFREFLFSKPFINFMSSITGIKLKEGVIDLHGSMYSHTDHLLCHDDDLQDRKIAFMFYLTDLEKTEGGVLELYDGKEGDANKIIKRIIPKAGTLTFFAIEDHPYHSVSEVIKDTTRISISGWFHG